MQHTARRLALTALSFLDYPESHIRSEYPVWVGPRTLKTDLVAFGSAKPLDMSTATIVIGGNGTADLAFDSAAGLAAPAVFLAEPASLTIFSTSPEPQERYRFAAETLSDLRQLAQTLGPKPLLNAKRGQRQLSLFPVDVRFLSTRRTRTTESLAPRLERAFEYATDLLSQPTLHQDNGAKKKAIRLTMAALTLVVLDHKNRGLTGSPDDATSLLAGLPDQFAWVRRLRGADLNTVRLVAEELAEGIDYSGIDARVLSHVYEHALNDRAIGIHYTPSDLAHLMLKHLPIEVLHPSRRRVLDPACGSGSLLLAAEDRVSEVHHEEQNVGDMAPQVLGYDSDGLSVEVTRLALLIAESTGAVQHKNTLSLDPTSSQSDILVMNPPWEGSNVGRVWSQRADEFVQWAMASVRIGGLLGVILPATWLTSAAQQEIREGLDTHFDVFEVWTLPERTFESARLAPCAIFAMKANSKRKYLTRRIWARRELDWVYSTQKFADGAIRYGGLAKAGGYRGFLAEWLTEDANAQPLRAIAEVATGPQSHAGFSKTQHQPTHGMILSTQQVPYLSHPDPEVLVDFNFPLDAQNGSRRGQKLVSRPKIVIPETKDPNYLWRLRPVLGDAKTIPNNKAQMIAVQEDDPDLLIGLAGVLASGICSLWIAETVSGQHISAPILRRLPVPEESAIRALARVTEVILQEQRPLPRRRLFVDLEEAVFSAYGAPSVVRDYVRMRMAGAASPEGGTRHPEARLRSEDEQLAQPSDVEFRAFGSVLAVSRRSAQVWIMETTPDAGEWIPIPERLSGWLCREGRTFEVALVDSSDLADGWYRVQPFSYLETEDELLGELRSSAVNVEDR